ncbi:hypothetical protein A2U01_0098974, partial [Trifolium medium]|nr:hypothetical protein [Trifolium medium]
MKACGIVEL